MGTLIAMVLSFVVLRIIDHFASNPEQRIGVLGQVSLVFLFAVSFVIIEFGLWVLNLRGIHVLPYAAFTVLFLPPFAVVALALHFGLHRSLLQSALKAFVLSASFWFGLAFGYVVL